ncbi:MAG: aminoglycoside phosphotransferase family protein [Flavobacteriia bacterium]|nr:aminoglycoside phosphotransferase family protein [Cryomorphaceae bacterium]
MDLRTIIQAHWGIAPTQVQVIQEGLINQSWWVRTSTADYVLQQINTEVFKHPLELQQQLVALSKSIQLDTLVPLQYCKTHLGSALIQAEDKTFRLLKAISPSKTLNEVTVANAQLAAAALLEFHAALGKLTLTNWRPPIDHFLDIDLRMQAYQSAKLSAPLQRLALASEAMSRIEANWAALVDWKTLSDQAERVLIHADPKLSNFLFHPNGKQVRGLIDWDTIQYGTPYYDYGDMIRSFCSYGEDADEKDGLFRADIFEALLTTFAGEQQNLFTAALGVITVQALRFLTDYLNGDVYYKVQDAQHNLRRATNQLELATALQAYWTTTRKRGQ